MNRILNFIWPIHRTELKKFLPISLMLLLTLFNYNSLRSLKDALVIPNIGAESISFIKFFCVVPTALLFVIIYTKMTNIWNFRRIYITITCCFALFFICYGTFLYPNHENLHCDSNYINHLLTQTINLGFIQIEATHFKWFILIYGNWIYTLFFMIAELWTVMNILLFWQFANQVVTTDEAKRFYPMFAFMGSFGTFIAGCVIGYISELKVELGQDTEFLMKYMNYVQTLVAFCIIALFEFVNRKIIKDPEYLSMIKAKRPEQKMTMKESFQVIAGSKYLRYIAISVISYGFVLNLLEGPWIAAARIVYNHTDEYLVFAANIHKFIGIFSMVLMLIGVYILKKYSWLFAAMITPTIFLVTGLLFFLTVIMEEQVSLYIGSFIPFDAMMIAVYIGSIQTILSKSTKYAIFDPTKEMTYIPIDYQLKSKGKAAVDVLGMKLAISGAALLQSVIFMIFPQATYLNIAGVLLAIFLVICYMWITSVRSLNKEYLAALAKHKATAKTT